MGDSVSLQRAVAEPPMTQWDASAAITFRHPGYESPSDILFRLPRLDSTEGTAAKTQRPKPVGVHHRTALLACQIIANNAFDGYLATDRDGRDRVTLGQDAVLTADSYWYIADRRDGDVNLVNGRDVYPIVPSFEDWAFPHDRFRTLGWGVPPRTAAPMTAESTADGLDPQDPPPPPSIPLAPPPLPRRAGARCVLSSSAYSLQKAHVVPLAQKTWFGDNVMAAYGRSSKLVDDEANIVYMRHDLHALWDAHVFALVPKRDKLAVHVLSIPNNGIMEFAVSWHNVPAHESLSHTSAAYMFAKFAQAVFMLLKPYIMHSQAHRFVARLRVQADDPRHGCEIKEEWLSGRDLGDLYSGGGSRSASASRKRSRSQASADNSAQLEGDDWYTRNVLARSASDSEDSEDAEAAWYRRNVPARAWGSDAGGEEERGRPRKRRRRQRRERSDHTVDTLPSLTDTSAVGVGVDDVEPSLEDSSALLPTPAGSWTGEEKAQPARDEETDLVC